MEKDPSILFRRAGKVIPGGVNSPVRAFRAVGGEPLFISRASGSRVYDSRGKEYIDYVASWGPMILGHAHPAVTEAVARAAQSGTSYGAPTEAEIEMAEIITGAIPSVEKIRMVNSGTEAVMSAVRLARAFTGRKRIVKFEGCYHGHSDSLLAKAGSGIATFGIPGSPGVPAELAALTITLPFNDGGALRSAFSSAGHEIACVIVEPVPGNMGVVPPKEGFLETLRETTAAGGSLLIFDEVITGFRLTFGGCQNLAGIRPDLTCLGKIIGGGLPVGAFGGKKEIMDRLAPEGPVYQAGTLSGNPLAMAAGIATLKTLRDGRIYPVINKLCEELCRELRGRFRRKGIPVRIQQYGSMFTPFFTAEEVADYQTAARSDTGAFAGFFREMLAGGINLPPSQFEASFISGAHRDADIDATITAADRALAKI
ncbi:MAG: glutamate-1-semialdehyde 2,1-aminomutase [Syntrophales bacterium]|nr:glutamate-1-semialdehyde 2,1-aminomutase [Syntrophales bacterium]MDD5233780.1 glutamate-1-semialdehyde 2,1-aminomutase [Syntrophales bacterium]MDD5532532.1 glutamate-1-semialdehyde 2,1-aminomutase [Syntrophales bacterium]HPL64150.1 glutamate-1-semialdehyde 2,1-aminomutase [Syntrophales bacterium]